MRIIKYILLLSVFTFASTLHQSIWVDGQNFNDYTKQNNINILSANITQDELYLIEQAKGSGQTIYELRDDNKNLQKILMPLGDEIQIALEKSGDKFSFSLTPIDNNENIYFSSINIKKDIQTNIRNKSLLTSLQDAVKKYKIVIQANDLLSIVYMQKAIEDHKYGDVELRLIRIQSKSKERTIVLGSDDTNVIHLKKEIKHKPYNLRFNTRKADLIADDVFMNFDLPLTNIQVTSSFSYGRYHPVLGIYRPHFGTDFRAPINTPVMAISDGVVIFSGDMGGYGKVVKIKHSNGYISLYAHLNEMSVFVGEKIKRRRVIATSGNSGLSSGPHLHLGIYHNGTPVNPMRFLR